MLSVDFTIGVTCMDIRDKHVINRSMDYAMIITIINSNVAVRWEHLYTCSFKTNHQNWTVINCFSELVPSEASCSQSGLAFY